MYIRPLIGYFMFFISHPFLFLLPTLFTIIVILAKLDFKYFHQYPQLTLLTTFLPLLIILAINWLNFHFKTLSCTKMCIMGNGNDPSAHIPSWKYPEGKHEFNKINRGLV